MCVCVREREKERESERESVCVCVREREYIQVVQISHIKLIQIAYVDSTYHFPKTKQT